MAQTSIICPSCQATLKVPSAMPVGLKPKCPRCGSQVPVAAPAGARALPSSGTNGMPVAPSPPGRLVNPVAAFSIIGGGALLLLLLTGALLFVCLRSDGPKDDVAKEEDPFDQLSIPTAQTPPKKIAMAAKPLIVLSPEDERKVDTATQRGVQYLKRTQIKDGYDKGCWKAPEAAGITVGWTALAGLTLLECHVPSTDPAIQNAASYVRQHGKQRMDAAETYQVALAILFLSRLDDRSDYQLVRSLGLRLVASQQPSGGWQYPSNPLTDEQEATLLALLQANPTSSVSNASEGETAPRAGAFQNYNGGFDQTDNSNTQFAVLGLWAARRYDLPLDRVLRLVAKRFQNSQGSDGSWKYQNGMEVSPYPTMTAAGLLGLAVGHGLDNTGDSVAKDEILQRAFKRLAQNVGSPGEFEGRPPPVELYFLWSVERVAVLYHQAKIDGKDWYRWGLEILLAHQYQDGKWLMHKGPGSSNLVDTCFALLFLQRANLAKDLTDKIQRLIAILGQPERKE
jgi:hypothetical protein